MSFYQFLQFRHAYEAQALLTDHTIHHHRVLDFLLQDTSTKGLISELYRSLLLEFSKVFPLQVQKKWESDIGPISEAQWVSVLGLTPTLSPYEALSTILDPSGI